MTEPIHRGSRAAPQQRKLTTGEVRLYRVMSSRNTWHIDHYWSTCRYKSLKARELIDRMIKVIYLDESVQKNEIVLGLKDIYKRVQLDNLCRDCQSTFIAKLKSFGVRAFLRIDEKD